MSTATAVLESPPPAPAPARQHDDSTNGALEALVTTAKPAGITSKTWHSLRTKQKRFVVFYAENPNAVSAYVAAGYDTTRDGREQPAIARNAYNVRRGQKITQALAEQKHHVDQRAEDRKDRNLDYVVSELERLQHLAEKKGDLAVAVNAVKLIGQTRGLFVETAVVDVRARREYSEAEQVEARHLARLRLEEISAGESDNSDHRGASMSNSAQDPAASQGGEISPADTAPEAVPGKVDTRADRTREDEHEQPAGMPLTPAGPPGYSGPDTITKPGEGTGA